MKKLDAIILMITCFGGTSHAVIGTTKSQSPVEIEGTLEQYLINPKGEVDGFLLSNGMQVKFPPHMSSEMTSTVSPRDEVRIKGVQENAKVFSAELVTNTKTAQSVSGTPPFYNSYAREDMDGNYLLPPRKERNKDLKSQGLTEFSESGRIRLQLFNRKGHVNGVILNNDTIIRFRPHLLEELRINTEVGKTLRASGYGTQNVYGKSVEAETVSNK